MRAIVADLEDRRWIKARWRELPAATRAQIWRAWFEIVSAGLDVQSYHDRSGRLIQVGDVVWYHGEAFKVTHLGAHPDHGDVGSCPVHAVNSAGQWNAFNPEFVDRGQR